MINLCLGESIKQLVYRVSVQLDDPAAVGKDGPIEVCSYKTGNIYTLNLKEMRYNIFPKRNETCCFFRG